MNLFIGLFGFLLLLGSAVAVVVIAQALLCAREVRNPTRRSTGWALARGFAADPGEAGLPFETWTLERPNGIELPVWEIPERTPSPESPILIMLHGWGQSRIEMLGLLDMMLKQGQEDGNDRSFRTIIPELRGHGEASSGSTTLGQEDIEDVKALIEQAGPGKVTLLGFSLGSVTAITVAAEQPESVSAVLALAPYERLLHPIAATLRSRQMPHGLTAKLVTLFATSRENGRRSTSRTASTLTCRLNVFVGAHDRIASPESGRTIAESAPHGTVHVVEDVGHVGLPGACAPLLARHLQEAINEASNDA